MSSLLLSHCKPLPPSPLATSSTPPSSPTVQSRKPNLTLPLSSAFTMPAVCPMSKSALAAPKNTNAAPAAASKADGKAKSARRGKLGPGCSLLDWIRLCRSKKDLGCNGGKPRPVTEEELAQHSTPDDAWTAIKGMQLQAAADHHNIRVYLLSKVRIMTWWVYANSVKMY